MLSKTNLDTMTDALGGPMSKGQREVLLDVKGFIDYCIANDTNFLFVLSTLAHDVNGLLTYQDAPWFFPKVTGYAKKMSEMADMASDPELIHGSGE